jgi:ABC-type antimicrobial peptide transport system permease subunit
MARRDWPAESPLGKRVKYQGEWREVIGIVGDTKYRSLAVDVQATAYVPLAQRAHGGYGFLVRTSVRAPGLIRDIRNGLQRIEPAAPLADVREMQILIRQSYAEERYRTTLISLFGVIAGVLAVVGLYGVTSRAVSRRSREMGIRVALGATPGNVIRVVMRYTLVGVIIGVVVGITGSMAVTRLLAPFLFGITASDPVAYGVSLLVLIGVSVAASWVPARRAALVQPAEVLRAE